MQLRERRIESAARTHCIEEGEHRPVVAAMD